jgi:mannose/fructose/N-acetylgalactosamine-specific phosphotransferase system component IIC
MKNNLLKIFLIGFFLLTDFIMFAQTEPGDEGDGGPPVEGGDPPAPIDSKLIWLGIVAILFAIYTFSRNKKQA